jgi:peptidase C39-like protein
MTDLFAVTSGLDSGTLRSAVPPACRRGVESAPPARLGRGEAVIEMPEWTPRRPARHFVPSIAILTSRRFSFRFELRARIDGEWTPWVHATPIGPARFESIAVATLPALSCDVDLFVARAPADGLRLRVRIVDDDVEAVLQHPWIVTLSASDPASPPPAPSPSGPEIPPQAHVVVPSFSQMEEVEAIRHRICSPTSVAMVLGRWGRKVEPAALSAEIYHEALDRYGVWPAAISTAARHGVAGYLLRFPDWPSAAWCLASGLPIVASVRYADGELTGAPVPETDGHLLVLTGYEGDDVLVSDPAAPTRLTVARRYRRAELERVWLERSGIGYVFFDPQRCVRRS